MSIFTQGLEIEFQGISKRFVDDLFHVTRFNDIPLSNLLRIELEHAESIEVIFPPLVYYANGFKIGNSHDLIKTVVDLLIENGATTSNANGIHVHQSILPIKNIHPFDLNNHIIKNFNLNMRPSSITKNSFYKLEVSRVMLKYLDLENEVNYKVFKDVVKRYTKSIGTLNLFFNHSRTNNRFAQTYSYSQLVSISNSNNFQDLINVQNGEKFYNINFLSITTIKTVEFRQCHSILDYNFIHNWMGFIDNLINHSINRFIEIKGKIEKIDSPKEYPSSRAKSKATVYKLCRTPDGASTRNLMALCENTEQRIRAIISELRHEFGQELIETVDAINQGIRYGSGTDNTIYKIKESYIKTTQDSFELKNITTRPTANIFGSLNDDTLLYFTRIINGI